MNVIAPNGGTSESPRCSRLPCFRSSFRNRAILLLVCSLLPLTTVADDDRRDGNWWRKRPRQDRLSYIVGFFDGIKLGNSFTIWSFMDERSEAAREARVRTFESYNTYAKRLARVTNDQVLDGLDTFFGDYQNRSIQIQDGFWVVLCNITGDSKEQIELLIQNLRSSVLIE